MAFNGTLAKLAEEDQRILLEAGEPRVYGPGNIILRHRTLVQGVFVVMAGQVRIEHGFQVPRMTVAKRADGSEEIRHVPGRTWTEVTTVGRADFFGEMSFIDDSPVRASVFAVGEVDVLFIPASKVREMLESDSGFAQRFYRSLANAPSERMRQTAPGAHDGAPSGEAEVAEPSGKSGFCRGIYPLPEA